VDKNYHSKKLFIDYCGYKLAVYSVMRWHYSRRMPKSKLVRFGVWENGTFIGAVIYGAGASPDLGKFLGCSQAQCCELVRVALAKHNTEVSKIVSYTLRKLKKDFPNLKAVISFADPEKKHKGTIYQAMNWQYVGKTASATIYERFGKQIHSKTISDRVRLKKAFRKNKQIYDEFGVIECRKQIPKHKYVYLFEKNLMNKINQIVKPYP
tara:strand:- start:641 stop:1267 length:627 start_codon:yes stop_codon:yes gene_type:complete